MRTYLFPSLIVVLLASGCARRAPLSAAGDDARPSWSGPNTVEVDLLRVYPGATSIYVQAKLPDGELGLFLVDSGAAVSVLSEKTAVRLGLEIQRDFGNVEGLGGRAGFHRAVLPYLEIGEAIVEEVEMAVGVPGVGEMRGAMPLDGILGNNVWSRFVMEVDYPADVLALHRPDSVRLPRRSDPMFFDGSHVFAPVDITTDSPEPTSDRVIIQVDTGAHGLMLVGRHGSHFESDFTEGLEPVLGIGGSEMLPISHFHRTTRHVPVASVEIGGRTVKTEIDAQWVNFDGTEQIGPSSLRGLAGHELVADHALWLDYRGGRIALRRSRRKARQNDGNAVLLAQDVERFGEDEARYLYRARLHGFLGDLEAAQTHLEAFLALPAGAMPEEETARARVLLASVQRSQGDLEAAWETLSTLGPGQLVDEHEIVAAVNGLVLDGRLDEAIELGQQAVEERPEEMWSHVALSDALFSVERFEEATEALLTSSQLAENPDAHLLRRARVSLAQGDRYGAMAQIRKLLKLYPYEGLFLWFYAELIEEGTDEDTFRHDMDSAMERLHPGDRPLDFLVAAKRSIGEDADAMTLMYEGIERDCSQAPTESSEQNCHAWYFALGGTEPAEALRLIDLALAETGDRSDFLDTKAMVHLSRGEAGEAYEAALAAARLAPDDVYMLWQVERLGRMASLGDDEPGE